MKNKSIIILLLAFIIFHSCKNESLVSVPVESKSFGQIIYVSKDSLYDEIYSIESDGSKILFADGISGYMTEIYSINSDGTN